MVNGLAISTGGKYRMLGPWGDRLERRVSRRVAITLVITLSVAVGASSYALVVHLTRGNAPAACRRRPDSGTSLLSGPPATVAAGVAKDLLGCAPTVVVANEDQPASVAAAVPLAEQAHAPLLLAAPLPATAISAAASYHGGAASARPALPASLVATVVALREVSDLHPRSVLAVGLQASELSTEMPRAHVTTDPGSLVGMAQPRPLGHVLVMVSKGGSADAMAATATAEAAGAQVLAVPDDDPRADPAAITTLSKEKSQQVIAVGSGFGPMSRLDGRLAVARTGVQFPGGGQLIVPMHRIVALYGHPGTPVLGALGEQGISASVARIKKLAASYQALSKSTVIPTFEIIASVATAAPGPGNGYSAETPISVLQPWVQAATAAGMYVILDLQPGRDNFLTQAQAYEPLLKLPNVGLALDPEWKLQPNQLPLQQIGTVSINEVNSVVNWLGQLTGQYNLPQKLLVLHQFKLGEIANEQRLDTSNDNLAIVMDMDGQGTPTMKQQTWNVITNTAPAGVPFGWKNFFVKDTPMLSPSQTMAKSPQPVMISYQ
jgi:hypothetical protein